MEETDHCDGFSLTRDATDAWLPGNALSKVVTELFIQLMSRSKPPDEEALWGMIFTAAGFYIGQMLFATVIVLSVWIVMSVACCCTCFNGRPRKSGQSSNALYVVVALLCLLLLLVASSIWQLFSATGSVTQGINDGLCGVKAILPEVKDGEKSPKEGDASTWKGTVPMWHSLGEGIGEAAQVVDDARRPLHQIWLTAVQDVIQHGKEELQSKLDKIEVFGGYTIKDLEVSDTINEAIEQADLVDKLDVDKKLAQILNGFIDGLEGMQRDISNLPVGPEIELPPEIDRIENIIYEYVPFVQLGGIISFGLTWLAFALVYACLKGTTEECPGRVCAGFCMQGCLIQAVILSIICAVLVLASAPVGAACRLSNKDPVSFVGEFFINLQAEINNHDPDDLPGSITLPPSFWSADIGALRHSPMKLAGELDKTCFARDGHGFWAEAIFGPDRDWEPLSKCIMDVPYEKLKVLEPHWSYSVTQHMLACLTEKPWKATLPERQEKSRRLAVADWAPKAEEFTEKHWHNLLDALMGKEDPFWAEPPPGIWFEKQLEGGLHHVLDGWTEEVVRTAREAVQRKADELPGSSLLPQKDEIVSRVQDEVGTAVTETFDGLLPNLKTHLPKSLESLEEVASHTFGQMLQIMDASLVPMTNCRVLGKWLDSVRNPVCSKRGIGGGLSALIWLCGFQMMASLVAAVLFLEVASTPSKFGVTRPHEPWGTELRRVT